MSDLKNIYRIVEIVRKEINKDLPIQQLALYLLVANRPGISMTEICRVLNMPQGSVSRNVKQLGCYLERRNGHEVVKGLDLLRTAPDPESHCRLLVFLTCRGQELASQFQSVAETQTYHRQSSRYSANVTGSLAAVQ